MISSVEKGVLALDRQTRERLMALGSESLAVTAVAGRDSIAAAIQALEEHPHIKVLVPTSIATFTEFGSTDQLDESVELLRERLKERFPDRDIEVLEHIRLGSPELWSALNARYAAELLEEFGMNSPCLACHLYVHIARVPIALALGAKYIITGERDTHDSRIKLSQTIDSIDAEIRVCAAVGIELVAPVRLMSGAEIDGLVPGWVEGEKQLNCVLSKNYIKSGGQVAYARDAHIDYVKGFYEPVGTEIVKAWAAGMKDGVAPKLDYAKIAGDILAARKA